MAPEEASPTGHPGCPQNGQTEKAAYRPVKPNHNPMNLNRRPNGDIFRAGIFSFTVLAPSCKEIYYKKQNICLASTMAAGRSKEILPGLCVVLTVSGLLVSAQESIDANRHIQLFFLKKELIV